MIEELQLRSDIFVTIQPPIVFNTNHSVQKMLIFFFKYSITIKTVSILSTLKGQFLQQFQQVR